MSDLVAIAWRDEANLHDAFDSGARREAATPPA